MGFDKQKDRALVQASLCFISYQIFMWWFSSRNFKIFYFTIGSGFWDHFFYYSQIWNVKIYPISKRQIFCQLLLENFCHSNCLQQCLSNSFCIEKWQSFSHLKMYLFAISSFSTIKEMTSVFYIKKYSTAESTCPG